MPRYFIATLPPEPVLSEIKAFKNDLLQSYKARIALRSPAHITLFPPFDRDETFEADLTEKLGLFAQSQSPFLIKLDGFGCFYPRVIFVKPHANELLNKLRISLLNYLKENLELVHERFEKQDFHPHLTIANRDLRGEDYDLAWQDFQNRTYQREFMVNSITLLKHDGQRWQVLQNLVFDYSGLSEDTLGLH